MEIKKILIICLIGWVIGYITAYFIPLHHNICTNNSSRNYEFEAYCDSIWNADPNYYLDVLTETEEYQSYIEKHGSWWSNDN